MAPFINSRLSTKILSYFFTNPESSLYVREIAGIIGEDPGNLSRELRKLEGDGIFISNTKGSVKLYSLDRTSPLFSELKSIIFKTMGIEGSLKKLMSEYEGVELSFIYGSYAKGSEKKSSDIDLVVVGIFPRDDFIRKIRAIESKLNREINFNSYTRKEFDMEKKKKGGFLNKIIKGNITLLKGSVNGR